MTRVRKRNEQRPVQKAKKREARDSNAVDASPKNTKRDAPTSKDPITFDKACELYGENLDDVNEALSAAVSISKAELTKMKDQLSTSQEAATQAKIDCFERGTKLALSMCKTLGRERALEKLTAKLGKQQNKTQHPINLAFQVMGVTKSSATRWTAGARFLLRSVKPSEFGRAIEEYGGFTKCLKLGGPKKSTKKQVRLACHKKIQARLDKWTEGHRLVMVYLKHDGKSVSIEGLSRDPRVCGLAEELYFDGRLSKVYGDIPSDLVLQIPKQADES